MRLITQVITSCSLGRFALAVGAALLLGGCQALAITAAGIGATTGLSHTANSISSRTFTANEQQVRQATLLALGKMGMKLESSQKSASIETLRASVADRSIEIEVEVLNEATTRISASAQRGPFTYDGATAREIVVQTELAMVKLVQARKARAPTKTVSASAEPLLSGAPLRH